MLRISRLPVLLVRPNGISRLSYCTNSWDKATDNSAPLQERAKAAFESGKQMYNQVKESDAAQNTKETLEDAAQSIKDSFTEAKDEGKKKDNLDDLSVKEAKEQAKEGSPYA